VFDDVKYRLQDTATNDIDIPLNQGTSTLPLETGVQYTLTARKGFFTVNQVTINIAESDNGDELIINMESMMQNLTIDGYLLKPKAPNDSINLYGPPITDQTVTVTSSNSPAVETISENVGISILRRLLNRIRSFQSG
jgi:hypothetical protein